MIIQNVRIRKYAMHFAVYKGNTLVGVAPTFEGAWSLAKVTV